MATDNKSLGRFILDGIPPAPRGVPQVEVIFDVDSNGVLKVTAKDKSTGKEQSIRIEANSGLTEADIERMKQDAEMHASEDTRKKELIEARNLADQMIYTAEKALVDHKDGVPADVKTAVEGAVSALKSTKDSDNIEDIKAKTAQLSTEMQKIGEAMAKSQNNPQNQNTNPTDTQNSESENVRDAEIDEDKKSE
jgi:molecular chaperone DnaK